MNNLPWSPPEHLAYGIPSAVIQKGVPLFYRIKFNKGYGVATGEHYKDRTGYHAEVELPSGEMKWICPGSLSLAPSINDPVWWKTWQNYIPVEKDYIQLCHSYPALYADPRMFSHYGGTKDILQFGSLIEIWMIMQFERLSIHWEYEENNFEFDEGSFTPDFYLPEWNLHVEITLGPRSSKRRKIKKLLTEYPSVHMSCIARGKMPELIEILLAASDKEEVHEWLYMHQEPWVESRKLL